jgi:CSLREA domain-containing protein
MTRAIGRANQRRAAGANRDPRAVVRRSGLAAGAAAGTFVLTAPAAQASNVQVNSLADGPADGCVNPCTLRDALTIANASAEADQITFLSSLSGTIHLSSGVLVRTGNYALDIDGPGAGQLTVSGDGNNNGTPDSRVFRLGDDNINDTGAFSVEGLTLTKGAGAPQGGAIFGYSSSDITLNNVTVSDSVATGQGAGIFLGSGGGGLTINNSTVSGNTSSSSGGGVFAYGPVAMSRTTISGNSAQAGAGVLSGGKYAPIEVTNSVVSGNQATSGSGGGIMIVGGSKYAGGKLNIVDTTISGNTAVEGGAGAFVAELAAANRLKVLRSTISGNQGGPSSFGGGLKIAYGTEGIVALVDSTISGNSATVGGGVSLGTDNPARVVGDTGSIEFNNSTIADNTATSRGGGMYLNRYDPGGGFTSATIEFNSTIVADNAAGGSAQDLDRANGSGGGGFDSGFSLIERRGDAPVITSGPNLLGIDPKLGPLADNGGSTRTQLPAPSSTAVDKGDSSRLDLDQRGFSRLVDLGIPNAPTGNGTDIGAVELRPAELPFNGRCAGGMATIIAGGRTVNGTNGPDVILGTNGRNLIRGRGGRDTICGLAGNDRLLGGGGPDRLLGGGGRDRLIGGPGRDRLLGGPGRDRLLGGGGRDILIGGPGRDAPKGGPGRDRQRQ